MIRIDVKGSIDKIGLRREMRGLTEYLSIAIVGVYTVDHREREFALC